jgi:hypothetical protein
MKRTSLILLLSVVFLFTFRIQGAETAEDKFEKIKSLAGDWQGVNPEGKPVVATYEVVSNGSAVMERLEPAGEPTMITMYHLDGNYLMMTHYCSAMNQPRMRATSDTDNENVINFSFLDITNLAKPSDGHMNKLQMNFKDEEHLSSHWTYVENNKEKIGTFELERVK